MDIKKEKAKLRKRLKDSDEEIYHLLIDKYPWRDKEKVLKFIRELLKDVDINLWPKDTEERITVKNGIWHLHLFKDSESYARMGHLMCSKDDHTAWVVEDKDGVFIEFEFGGS